MRSRVNQAAGSQGQGEEECLGKQVVQVGCCERHRKRVTGNKAGKTGWGQTMESLDNQGK